jgi:hypothetical protein
VYVPSQRLLSIGHQHLNDRTRAVAALIAYGNQRGQPFTDGPELDQLPLNQPELVSRKFTRFSTRARRI